MNTLHRLACLALLLPACLGPRAVDSDVPEDIEQVIFYHYPAAPDATSTASTSAPSDEASPEAHSDEAALPEPVAASPMEATDDEPTESPATRDDEPSPTPAVDAPAAEPEASPEALDDEPEPEPLRESGDFCERDEQCKNGSCERLEYAIGTGPLVFVCALP